MRREGRAAATQAGARRKKGELLPLDVQQLLEMTDEERAKKEKYDREMAEYVFTLLRLLVVLLLL